MDNYNLSDSLLSGHSVDSGEHHSWLTDEENSRATFSGRSANVSTSEQVERQQRPSTGDEQIPNSYHYLEGRQLKVRLLLCLKSQRLLESI